MTADACAPPELAYSVRGDECGRPQNASVFRVDAPVSSEELAASECAVREGTTFYRTTPADDEVVWVEQGWTGTGRLQAQAWRDDEGRELRRMPRYWDRVLDLSCYAQETTAGMRCVPDVPWIVYPRAFAGLYADPSCTALAVPSPCFGLVLDRDLEESCGVVRRVYRVGAPIARAYVDLGPGGCVLDETVTEGHALEPTPLESLARVELRID